MHVRCGCCNKTLSSYSQFHPSLYPADLSALTSGGHLVQGVEAVVRQLSASLDATAPNGNGTCQPPDALAAASVLWELTGQPLHDSPVAACALTALLLLSGQDVGQGTGASGHVEAGLPAAASLVVAVGKLLWRCEESLADELQQNHREDDTLEREGWLRALLHAVYEATCLGAGNEVLFFWEEVDALDGEAEAEAEVAPVGGDDGASAAEGDAAGAARNEPEEQQQQGQEEQDQQQQQEQEDEVAVQRGVQVCAYAAWRWLPPLASLARRMGAGGHVPLCMCHVDAHGAMLVWKPLLVWAKRVCLRHLHEDGEQGAGTEAAGAGSDGTAAEGTLRSQAGAGTASATTSGAGVVAGPAEPCVVGEGACCEGGGSGAGGQGSSDDGDGGQWCDCWREFLLREVGLVELLGAALGRVVPAALAPERQCACCAEGLLWEVAEVCVLVVAAFSEEVSGAAWGLQEERDLLGQGRGGAADTGGSCGRVGDGQEQQRDRDTGGESEGWSLDRLVELAELASGWEGGQPLARGLRVVEEWVRECRRSGRAAGLSDEQLAAMGEALWGMSGIGERSCLGPEVVLVPPLCELRALIRVCSSSRCGVLPPAGQTEAEAGERAGLGPEKGCGGAWYCSAPCRR